MFFDWVTFGEPLTFWQMVLRIVAAVVFGAIIGVEREMKNRPDHRGLPVVRRLPGAGGGSRVYHHGDDRLPGGNGGAEADAADRACEHVQTA